MWLYRKDDSPVISIWIQMHLHFFYLLYLQKFRQDLNCSTCCISSCFTSPSLFSIRVCLNKVTLFVCVGNEFC